MAHELLFLCVTGIVVTGSLGLLRPVSSRGLNAVQELAFWVTWAIVGTWLLVMAGLVLFVPLLGLIVLFNMFSKRNEQHAKPRHVG